MDSRQHPRDSKAPAKFAQVPDLAVSPASDLDIFTTAELEQQADMHYRHGTRLFDRLAYLGHWTHEARITLAAGTEQFELMRACHLELARRFAEDRANA